LSIRFFRTRMSIRRRLMANAIITVCLALLVASTLYVSTRELEKASKTDEFADQVVKDVSILNSLSYAYLLLKGERPRMQWQLKHDSLGRLLSGRALPGTETRALLERLQQNHKQIKDLFDLLSMRAGQDGNSPATGSSPYDELNEGVTSQLMTRAELMVNDASLLARLAGQKVDRLHRITLILVLASAVLLILVAVATTVMLIKSIGGSIDELNQGVREIGSGNLGYRVKVRGNDEIGLVATSFNDMAAKLAASDESLREVNQTLEQRVAELRHAEETARRERQRLFDVLEALPPMICLLTPYYHISFANRSFREKFGESGDRHCYEQCFGRTGPCDFCESYRVLETGRPHHWEVAGPDGSVIDTYDFPFVDLDGTPLILEMDIDITQQKRTEAELKEYQEHLEDLVNERTKELARSNEQLKAVNEELNRFNIAMIGRELRMMELKKEVNRLAARLGEPAPYKGDGEVEPG